MSRGKIDDIDIIINNDVQSGADLEGDVLVNVNEYHKLKAAAGAANSANKDNKKNKRRKGFSIFSIVLGSVGVVGAIGGVAYGLTKKATPIVEEKVVVNFNAGEGGEITSTDTFEIKTGTLWKNCSRPTVKSFVGKKFDNWITTIEDPETKEQKQVVLDDNYEIKENLKFTARYVDDPDCCEVTLNLDGGVIEGVTTESIFVIKGQTTLGSIGKPTKTRAKFLEWRDNDGTPLADDFVFTDNIKINAFYTSMYKITFDAGIGGKITGEKIFEVNEGTRWAEIGKPEVIPYEKYKFVGWINPTTRVLFADQDLLEDNMIISAKYENTIYLNFEPQGGTMAQTKLEIPYGAKWGVDFNIPDVTREGYKFVKWVKVNTAGAEEWKTGDVVNDGDTAWATWEKTASLVTFNPGEGEIKSGQAEVEVKVTDPATTFLKVSKPVVERTGWTFEGWFDKPQGAEDAKIIEDNFEIVNSFTAYAHYTDDTVTHTKIIFNKTKGQEETEILSGNTPIAVANELTFGEVNKPIVHKDSEKVVASYLFINWFAYDTEGNIVNINDTDNVKEVAEKVGGEGASELNLYPEFKESCFIKFDIKTDDGEYIKSKGGYAEQEVAKGTAFGDVNRPQIGKDGYKLDEDETLSRSGWLYEDDTTPVLYTDKVNENITIHASWTPDISQVEIKGPKTVLTTDIKPTYTAKIYPESFKSSIAWSILDATTQQPTTEYGTIDNNGVLTPTKAGNVIIQAVAIEGGGCPGGTGKYSVTIKEPYQDQDKYFAKDDSGNWYTLNTESLCDEDSKIKYTKINETTEQEIDRSEFNWEIWIGGNITYLDNCFLINCTKFDKPIHFETGKLFVIGEGFLAGCTTFNQKIVIPNTVTYIQNGFLQECTSFNSSITIGSNVRTIDEDFLWNCTSFDQDLIIPENVAKVGANFMENCKAMTHTITVDCESIAFTSDETTCTSDDPSAACVGNIKIAGKSADEFINKFYPVDTNNHYRRLIKAE